MFHTIMKELKSLDKKIWIGFLTVLIILIIGTSYHIKNNVKNEQQNYSELVKIGVINKDSSAYSDLLLSYFDSSETFTSFIKVITGTDEEINQEFDNGKLDVVIEIPENFAQNLINIKHSPIRVEINTIDITKAILLQNVLRSYERYISAVEVNAVGLYELMEVYEMDPQLISDTNTKLSIDLILTALGKEKFFSFRAIGTFPSTSLANYYITSIFIMLSLYFGLYAGYELRKEMGQGTLIRLRTTKLSVYRYVLGKNIAMAILPAILLGGAITFLTGKIHLINFVFAICIAMFSIAMAVCLCGILRTTQSFILTGNVLIFLLTLIGGGIIPIQFLPQDMLLLTKFTPYYYLMKGILNINYNKFYDSFLWATGILLIALLMSHIGIYLLKRRSVIQDEG